MLPENWEKIIINGQETFYSISNYGRVRNDLKNTFLRGTVSNNGYRMVHLRYRIDKYCSIHRLVMKAFCPCENMDDLQINHKDGNKLNNYIENLEWCTCLENMRHSFLTGLQPRSMIPCYQYDLEGNFLAEFANSHEAAKILNCESTDIWRCVTEQQQHYRTWQFKKYKKEKIPSWSDLKKNKVWVYNDAGDFIAVYDSQRAASKAFGVGEASISRYINQTRKLKGFVFSKIPL